MSEASRVPRYSDEVYALMDRTDEMITAADIAPIVHMSPDVIVHYAKHGKWNLCQYVVSGYRVKFSRLDFLRKMGFIPPEETPEKPLMEQIRDELIGIRAMLAEMRENGEKPHEAERADLS